MILFIVKKYSTSFGNNALMKIIGNDKSCVILSKVCSVDNPFLGDCVRGSFLLLLSLCIDNKLPLAYFSEEF